MKQTLILAILIAIMLLSCYTSKKAAKQLSKAVSTYPELGANYCAFAYPVQSSTIYVRGKDSTKHDTTQVFINCDSAINAFNKAHPNATPQEKKEAAQKVYVPVVKRDTIFRIDTVKITEENKAWIKALQIDSARTHAALIAANEAIIKKNKTLRKLWIALSIIIALIGVGAYFKFLK